MNLSKMNLTPLLFLSLYVLVAHADLAPRTNDVLEEQLYNSVVIGDYDNAVTKSIELEREHKDEVITEVVNRLLRDSKRNTVEYSYKLWNNGGKEIVKHHFPIQYRLILDENYVKLISKRDNLAIKLALATDDAKDRLAYGDGNDKISARVSWKLIPIWENNKVYFKIANIKHNQYLKMEVEADSMDEHKVWGSDGADTYRHQWYLHPVKYENDLLFFIYNREYNQALKLGRAVDSDGDRILWGHKGNVIGNPDLFGWFVVPF